jgi:beta-phosphoglucomutase
MTDAVIFDMNGVLIVDEEYHAESWRILCKKYGFVLTDDEFEHQVTGKRDVDTLDYLFKRKLTAAEANIYADERDAIAEQLVKGKLALPDGLIDLLDGIVNKNIPMAIATSSRRGYVNFILDNFGLRKYFPIIVTAEDIKNGKPDPEMYHRTAEILGVKPDKCLVFEDSRSGVKSAKAAGMYVVGITSSIPKDELAKIADTAINSFSEFDRNLLKHD